jgi:hypothetical protein
MNHWRALQNSWHQETAWQRNCGMLRCLEIEFLSLSASCVAVSPICAAPFSNMCSTQADNNSRKLRLRCGCQFPWCALALTPSSTVPLLAVTSVVYTRICTTWYIRGTDFPECLTYPWDNLDWMCKRLEYNSYSLACIAKNSSSR